MKHGVKKQQILVAADDLFYRQGFEYTSFADITSVVGISRGNLYHHFKTKDDILDAVIEVRMGITKDTLDQWEFKGKNPIERLEIYFDSLLTNWSLISEHGCPVGSLCNELAKLNHGSREDAVKIFTLFRQWLKNQFIALNSKEDPDVLAIEMLSWGQGVASMSNAFKDIQYVKREIQKMRDWLQELPVKKPKNSQWSKEKYNV